MTREWKKHGRYGLDLAPLRERARREGREEELNPDRIALAHASFLEFLSAKRSGKLPMYEYCFARSKHTITRSRNV